MVNKVVVTPILPRPPGADTRAQAQFAGDLIKALYRVIGEQAQTINALVEIAADHEARITALEP